MSSSPPHLIPSVSYVRAPLWNPSNFFRMYGEIHHAWLKRGLGEIVWGEFDRSIKIYYKLGVVCSESSLQSVPVQREIERALNREDKEHKNILFPIRIDNHIFEEWEHPRKADVLAKVVGDFSGWEHDAAKYENAFERLLKGLHAEK